MYDWAKFRRKKGAVDRGYIDYDLFDYWTGEGVWFVTRAKKNMAYEVMAERQVPDRSNVLVTTYTFGFRGFLIYA